MAVSIPIFTGQLRKARLATNQANARAAYAAATTEFMLEYAENGATGSVSYTYTAADGTGAFDEKLVTADSGLIVDISKWDKDNTATGGKLGDVTEKKWTVVMDKDGKVTGYKGATS